MSESTGSLWNYATHTRILRDPAEQHGRVVCPECGRDIEETKGTGDARIPVGSLVDAQMAAELEAQSLPTHGWVCTRHPQYDVVCPARSESLPSWGSILVQFADGHARQVPVPSREVRCDG